MTIAGNHTPAETRELIKQKDRDLAAMANAFLEFESKWIADDIDEAADYRTDLEDLNARWSATMVKAKAQLDSNPLPISEGTWQDILHTLQREPGHFQKGDFPDLLQRLANKGKEWRAPVNQPGAPDFDLDIYKTADKVFQATSKTGMVVLGALGIFGLVVLVKKL